jgi:hypothetical protein
MANVEITSDGIKKNLKKYEDNFPKALAEYVWNGFDAGANIVEIVYAINSLGAIAEIRVKDNGSGINHTTLDRTFRPYLATYKRKNISTSRKKAYYTSPSVSSDKLRPIFHAKNGTGRLTFFTFARKAEWQTTYRDFRGENKSFSISVDSVSLIDFTSSDAQKTEQATGTIVNFYDVRVPHDFEKDVIPYLQVEFSWFLALNSNRNFKLLINGQPLEYQSNILEEDDFSKMGYKIRYIQWRERPSTEYSHIYFYSNEKPVSKRTTSFNNKGDNFYHSVFVSGELFDSIPNDWYELNYDLSFVINSDEYKKILEGINSKLLDKRRPALAELADRLIDRLEKESIFPQYSRDALGMFQQKQIQQIVKEIFIFEPRIFSGLNEQQEKTIINMIDLIINSESRENLIVILDKIINLKSEDRDKLAEILKSTRLTNVIDTIQFIENRMRVIEELDELVFNRELGAKEKHLQIMIENNFWLFGEEFQLVVAENGKFEEALRKHIYILTGVEEKNIIIDDPDKLKEMDLFIVRKHIRTDEVNNIIVELKHPLITINQDYEKQVEKYMKVIFNEPRFKGRTWDFYLIGNKIDSFLDKKRGRDSTVLQIENYRLYIKTWREIFNDFEIRYNFLLERLKFECEFLSHEITSADDIVESYFPEMHPDDLDEMRGLL